MATTQAKKWNSRMKNNGVKKKTLSVGDICDLKITALAPNNIGIDEFSYPFAIFVPNANQGNIKAKIVKKSVTSFKDSSYAVAQLVSMSDAGKDLIEGGRTESEKMVSPVKPGDVLTVDITKKSAKGAGIVEFSPDYKIIVPLSAGDVLPKKAKITITRVKANYAFSTLLGRNFEGVANSMKKDLSTNINQMAVGIPAESKLSLNKLMYGCKFTTILPENIKKYNNYGILKINGPDPVSEQNGGSNGNEVSTTSQILFVKLQKGLILGRDKVRIKVTRDIGNSSFNCAIGKIIQINPVSKEKKATLVMNSIREMLSHGMHFGEKTVKCHARMKQYIWLKKQAPVAFFYEKGETPGKTFGFSGTVFKENGGPRGNKVSAIGQNKNRPFVKKGQHVINLLKTRRCLNKALNTLTKYALKGRTFLFIGTKKPATGLIARASFFTKNSFYVNTRWLGGMLTNWKTICKSISKIRPILREKQKVVRDILERRQTIKSRFIKRALLLKKKSKLILIKGRQILQMFKNNTNDIALRAQKFADKRNVLMTKGMLYIQKRQKLIQKRRELIDETLFVKEKGLQISFKYKMLFNQLAAYSQKLREYKYLLMLSSEMKSLQKTDLSLYTVPYGTLKNIKEENIKSWIVPNPPKEILNRVALATVRSRENDSSLIDTFQSESGSTTTSRLRTSKATTGNIVVCSSLLLRFASQLSSYIQMVIKTLISSIQTIEKQCNDAYQQLKQIETTLQTYDSLKNKYVIELQQLKAKAIGERHVIQIVKRQFKALDAQKKLIKFLPRLRYLPTPQTKISEIVQILLSTIVDPKLKFPIENIYDKNLSSTTKKLAAARKKKWQRLEKYFGGIANMTKLSQSKISNNVAIIIGQQEEMNAVRECNKLGLKTFTIVDTNCDPTLSNHIIPANDDSRNSIKYILTKFITRIRLAQKIRSRFLKYQKNAV